MRLLHLIISIITVSNISLTAVETKIENSTNLSELGIKYINKKATEPLDNSIHILQINLKSKLVRPKVELGPDPDGEGKAEASLSDPRKLASHPSVLAFINTNPWDSFPNKEGKKNRSWYLGQPVDIHGLAGTNSNMRSTIAPGNTSVWFDEKGKVYFGHKLVDTPKEATSGFQLIVSDGKLSVNEGGPRHPRTAIGTDKKKETLWLVVVDGRQKGYSEGMNLHELATVMKNLGCWVATNMDGGGSSVMGLLNEEGKMKIMNRPSDRFLGVSRIRPLPMVLTIRKN
tara:strand:+ start:7224 stop:8081 length:858 start_codon:yes stop_codon:yes gene_type:complete